MTNRFPLILNTSDSTIQELPSGDNLDLTGSNISNVGNITGGNSFSANYFVGNLYGQANTAVTATSATTAGTVTTNAQPNITSTGTLTSVTVSGTSNLGAVGNVKITGGSANQFIQTDGAGNLTFTTVSGDSYALKPVKAATINNITLSGTQTIDGISCGVGDRVLVWRQGTASENGIYVVASGSWTRATDFNTGSNTLTGGILVSAQSGTNNGSVVFICTNTGAITIGSTAITFDHADNTGWVSIWNSNDPFLTKAIGATNSGAVGIGVSANAAVDSTAVGYNAYASGGQGVSIGYSSTSQASGVAVGVTAASYTGATSIGRGATASGTYATTVGYGAIASTAQSIAIGYTANTSGANGIAIGNTALSVGTSSISIGNNSNSAGGNSIAIGINSVATSLSGTAYGANANAAGIQAVAIGTNSKAANLFSISIGPSAGGTASPSGTAGQYTTSIGWNAGYDSPGSYSIGLGARAGYTLQGANGIAIGAYAGYNTQGTNTIAIGANAGYTTQASNTIILNATGSNLDQSTANTFTVKPVRSATSGNVLYYDSTSGEISYGLAATPTSLVNGTSNVAVASSGNVTIGVAGTSNVLVVTSTDVLVNNVSVGTKTIPINSESVDYTLVADDNGKLILHPSADTTARTFTIPSNGSVPFATGTTVTFVNQASAGNVSIAITTDTMRLAGNGATGTRTLAANGLATAIKLTSTEWIISGVGLT